MGGWAVPGENRRAGRQRRMSTSPEAKTCLSAFPSPSRVRTWGRLVAERHRGRQKSSIFIYSPLPAVPFALVLLGQSCCVFKGLFYQRNNWSDAKNHFPGQEPRVGLVRSAELGTTHSQ